MKTLNIHPTYYVGHPDGSYSEAAPQPSHINPALVAALESCERVLSDLPGVTQEGSAIRRAWVEARAALREAPQ